MYDVIVIGGGHGGLTAANRLAGLGYRVLLLERHTLLGGLAAYFRRKGHVFDVSLHAVPYGIAKSCRKYWTREIAEAVVPVERIVFDNPQFSLETTFDFDAHARVLNEHFHVDPAAVARFLETVRALEFFNDSSETTGDLIKRCFPGRPDVLRFLVEPFACMTGATLDDPAIAYAIITRNLLERGAWTFRGGTKWLIGRMDAELRRNGVEIVTGAEVERILIEGGRAVGVVVDGREIRSRSVISNANLRVTVLELIGAQHLPPEFVSKVEAVRLSTSCTQVFLGIRRGETLPQIGDVLFSSTAAQFDTDLLHSREVTTRSFTFYTPRVRPDHDRCAVVASTNAYADDWLGLDADRYEAEKLDLIERTIVDLERYVPGVREIIDHREAATPVTIERYSGHPGGAAFGTKYEALEVVRDLASALPGAFHTGSAALIMTGWLGAMNHGAITANRVDEYLSTAT